MEHKLHIKRSEDAYKAFQLLKDKGLAQDALSRGYYTILHLCYAILIKNRIEIPKTHSGLISRLWMLRDEL